jgi:predicted ATPase
MTQLARAIHQNHDYGHIAGGQKGAYWGEEARRSLAIYGGVPHAFTLLDVTHELLPSGRIRRVHFRREAAAVHEWLWKTVIQPTSGLRGKLGLKRKTLQELGEKVKPAKH